MREGLHGYLGRRNTKGRGPWHMQARRMRVEAGAVSEEESGRRWKAEPRLLGLSS